MAHYKVILAYDGTDYQGFQRQAEGRTIQASVESALYKIGWKGTSINGAGRTDAGVHASGQVIGFEHDWDHPDRDLQAALNANLPLDIAALSVEQVSSDFHPRYSAIGRRYLYRLFCDEIRQPLKERYAWRVWPPMSMERLAGFPEKLVGEHDFSAFGTSPKPGGSTVRQIFYASWRNDQEYLLFEILGNAFLYHMVRRLVSYQVEVGQGKRDPEDFNQLVIGNHEEPIRGLAPASGLTLSDVRYPN
ncbi:MAG: tRNA pseudouridine(38-40) synthase TruA [Anaerolineales bacterium]